MQQHGHVVRFQTQSVGGFIARQLLEHAQGHDVAMHIAELGDAADQLRRGRLLIKRVVGSRLLRRQVNIIDIDVGSRVMMTSSPIARGVAHDGRQQSRRIGRPRAQRCRVVAAQQRTKRFLYDVERIGWAHAFGTRNPG